MLINGKYRCAGCMTVIESNDAICSCGFNNATEKNSFHCLQIGTVISDQYVVGRVIGEGGFGITYVGWDKDLDIKVAIKEFFMNGFATRDATVSGEISAGYSEEGDLFNVNREKFINEAKILASFKDEPGIVDIFRFFKANNTAYIVMEFVEGRTLKEYLKMKSRLSVDETLGIVGPIMNSLAKVHAKGLAHRDISPDNIMITTDGKGKLIDFGAARETNGNKSLSVVLKHGYAPIEQYQTHGNQGPWTDVYALSATIYRCITGQIPVEAIDRISGRYMPAVCEIVPDCNVYISNAIMKGLSINYEERYQTVNEMKNALFQSLNSVASNGQFRETPPVQIKNLGASGQINQEMGGQGDPQAGNVRRMAKANGKVRMLNGIMIAEIAVIVGLIIAIIFNFTKNI
ncbi:MAG: serine/threonine protein kinase, partial [Lachnospiraceae bacterium]|nr:serine/threonine protein kinase [Candidatus Colinaster scatohippi]